MEFLEEAFKSAAAAEEKQEEGVGRDEEEKAKESDSPAADDKVDKSEGGDNAVEASEGGGPRRKRDRGECEDQITEPPDEERSGGEGLATGRGAMTGFGAVLRGERETVELALQALSKVCR